MLCRALRRPDPVNRDRRTSPGSGAGSAFAVALAAAATLLVAGAPAARAQQDGTPAWRDRVDLLLGRWSDDQGAERALRAKSVLATHLEAAPQDGEARLELGRLELATGRAAAAVEAADRAARDLPAERRAVARALGHLAALAAVQEEARALPDRAAMAQRLADRQPALEERRRALRDAAGGDERAAALLRDEQARQRALRALDRLGVPPRPIGHEDRDGRAVDLTSYRGRVLLVLFWDSADPACCALAAGVAAVVSDLGPRGLDVVAVDVGAERAPHDEETAALGPGWRHCFAGLGLLRDPIARAWGVHGLPDGVLVDPTGRVRYVRPWDDDLRLAASELVRRREDAEARARERDDLR